MRAAAERATPRHELIGLAGVVERNLYLVKRYIWWDVAFFVWTVANTLTIVFIAKGIQAAGGKIDVDADDDRCSSAPSIWAYLGIIFEILTETVAWERWEGTIEYTFMAPLSRPVHLFGMGAVRRSSTGSSARRCCSASSRCSSGCTSPTRTSRRRSSCWSIASISFIGIGMMTAVLPLISPEKGMQLGFVAQGILLVVSGVYYPVSVLPGWMQALSTISPATYALRGIRAAILDGAG